MSVGHIVNQTLCCWNNQEKKGCIHIVLCIFHVWVTKFTIDGEELKSVLQNLRILFRWLFPCWKEHIDLMFFDFWDSSIFFFESNLCWKKKRKLTPFSFHTIYTTFSIKKWWTAFNVAFVKINLFCSLSSFKTTSSFTFEDFHMEAKRKKKYDKSTLSTQKNVRPLVGLFQPKRHLLLLSEMKVLMKIRNKTDSEAN